MNHSKKPKKKKKLTSSWNAYKSTMHRDTYTYVPPCHTGNNLLFTIGEKDAGLYIGGWSRAADPPRDWAVIDLSGDGLMREYQEIEALNKSGRRSFARTIKAASPRRPAGPWLSLPIRDFDIPNGLGRSFWLTLANDVKSLLEAGTNVLVACYGGHGRSGMTACILTGILRPDLIADNPITWIWENYCACAVETLEQELYIYRMLDMKYTTLLCKYATWQKDATEGVSPPSTADKNVINSWDYDGVKVVKYENGSFDSIIENEDLIGDDNEYCPTCNGLGYVPDGFTLINNKQWENTKLCPDCDGFGIIPKLR